MRDPVFVMYASGVVALLTLLIAAMWAGFRDLFR